MKFSVRILTTLFFFSFLSAGVSASGRSVNATGGHIPSDTPPARKKVAVVLSGGGAKGISHIGVLKVLEEAGIPVDYVVGTSMGSIVGGLYAIGYDAARLDSLVRNQDWLFLLTDRLERPALAFPEKEKADKFLLSLPVTKDKRTRIPAGLIKGQNIYSLFTDLTVGYHRCDDFSRFPIPFACVATDIVTGKPAVLKSGSLPLAMRASMSIPGVFTPVKLDSMLLIDGGIVNNFPCDVAESMGADIIIGVNVLSDLKNMERLNNATDIIGQIIDMYSMNGLEENKRRLAIYIRPELSDYNAANFTPQDVDSFLVRGERAARAHWDEMVRLKEKIGLSPGVTPAPPPYYRPHDSLFIGRIRFDGIPRKDRKWLLRKSGLAENNRISRHDLRKAIDILYGTKAYSGITYELEPAAGRMPDLQTPVSPAEDRSAGCSGSAGRTVYDLHLKVTPLPMSSLNFGVRFDTEEVAALLLNLTLNLNTRYNSTLALTGRASQNPYVRLDYSIDNSFFKRLNIGYLFHYNDVDLYDHGRKTHNVTFRRHLLEAGITDIYWQNFKFQLGLRFEHFDYNTILASGNDPNIRIAPEKFLSYFAQARLETLDSRYFPTRGVGLRADYALYTDNLTSYKGGSPFSALSLEFLAPIRCTPRFHIVPSVYGRTLIGHRIAYSFRNIIGGTTFGKYFPQQLPFTGINRAEAADNSVLAARVQFRYRAGSNHYISALGNLAAQDNNFFHLPGGDYLWGAGLNYAYNSMFGPLEATLGYSNHTDKVGFYLSLGYTF